MSNDELVAIVTGANSGIGLAIATKFAEAEYRVVLSGRGPKVGKKNAQAIERLEPSAA